MKNIKPFFKGIISKQSRFFHVGSHILGKVSNGEFIVCICENIKRKLESMKGRLGEMDKLRNREKQAEREIGGVERVRERERERQSERKCERYRR